MLPSPKTVPPVLPRKVVMPWCSKKAVSCTQGFTLADPQWFSLCSSLLSCTCNTFFPAFLHVDSLPSVWASGEIREHLTNKSLFPFDVKGVHCSPSKNHFFHSQRDKFSLCSLEGKQNQGLHSAMSIRQLKVLMFPW